MKWYRKFILLFLLSGSLWLFFNGIKWVFVSPPRFKDLIHHNGVVSKKSLFKSEYFSADSDRPVDSLYEVSLTLNNGREFLISTNAEFINSVISIGDSVDIYTLKLSGTSETYVTDGGTRFWPSKDQRQVFHLNTKAHGVLIDFKAQKHAGRTAGWMFLFLSVLIFLWFIYERNKLKSPLIMTRTTISI